MEKHRVQVKTWPYGTTFEVEVISASPVVLAVATLTEPKEGFIIAYHKFQHDNLPAVGEKGVITFTKGGPNGGYWDYNKKVANG